MSLPQPETGLAAAAAAVLREPEPAGKVARTREMAAAWRGGKLSEIGTATPPDRPARPARPELRPPREMAKRGRAHSTAGRIALLHAIAHIELNAIDLACDIVARFAGSGLPEAFFDDWVGVADDEARHFAMLERRLGDLGTAYGELPAHDGLWQAAEATAHDVLARLAIVPLVLEARGLDVTPAMAENLRKAGDTDSAGILETILREEVGHVAAGTRWFTRIAADRGLEPIGTFHALVRRHFRGALKAPFNRPAREKAGLDPAYYLPLSGGAAASESCSGRPTSPGSSARRHREAG